MSVLRSETRDQIALSFYVQGQFWAFSFKNQGEIGDKVFGIIILSIDSIFNNY